jgi:hypothetical protein
MRSESHVPVRNQPLIWLVVLHLAAMIATAFFWTSGHPDWRLFTILGLAMTQAILASYGATLLRSPLAWRWPLSALLVAGESVMAVACIRSNAPWDEGVVLVTATLFGLWALVQVPLWVLRVRLHLCISRGETSAAALRAEETQFGIKHILLWTAVVALMCGIGRLVFTSALIRAAMELRPMIVLSLLVMFSGVLSLLPLWAGLATSRRGGWWAITLLSSAFVIVCQPLVIDAALGGGPRDYGVLFWMGFVEVGSLLVSLSLLRAAGFRLVRLRQ